MSVLTVFSRLTNCNVTETQRQTDDAQRDGDVVVVWRQVNHVDGTTVHCQVATNQRRVETHVTARTVDDDHVYSWRRVGRHVTWRHRDVTSWGRSSRCRSVPGYRGPCTRVRRRRISLMTSSPVTSRRRRWRRWRRELRLTTSTEDVSSTRRPATMNKHLSVCVCVCVCVVPSVLSL